MGDEARQRRTGSSAHASSRFSATSNTSASRSRSKLGPIYSQVMQRRGANVLVEAGDNARGFERRRRDERRARGAEHRASTRYRRTRRRRRNSGSSRRAANRRMNDQPVSAAVTSSTFKRVMAALPHRYPMLLVDRVEAPRPGPVDHRDQGRDDQRAIFPGSFPGSADHAWRADRRGARAGGGCTGGRIASASPDRASSSISWPSKARSSAQPVEPGVLLKLDVEFVQKRATRLQIRRSRQRRRQARRRGKLHRDDCRSAVGLTVQPFSFRRIRNACPNSGCSTFLRASGRREARRRP